MPVVRLGEQLVSDGLLSAAQLEQALRAQVMWGGRLGTNLVELGYVDLDALSRALGRQHQLPAALARHFERGDRELQKLLSSEFAERYTCVPLMRVGEERSVVVAVASPLSGKPLAIVADELSVEPRTIIQSVAAELRIRYHLERVYQIPRGARFLRSRGPSIPVFPQFSTAPAKEPESAPDHAIPQGAVEDNLTTPSSAPSVAEIVSARPAELERPPDALPAGTPPTIPPVMIELEPDDDGEDDGAAVEIDLTPEIPAEAVAAAGVAAPELDDLSTDASAADERDDPQDLPAAPKPAEPPGRDRRQYVRTLADMVDTEAAAVDHKTLGRIAIRRVAVNAEANSLASTFPEATRAIRRATDRDRIAELAMAAIDRYAPTCDAAMLLVVRGEVAIGWKGFVRNAPPPPEFAVPLDRPGLCVVARKHTTARCSAADLAKIDHLLLEALGRVDGDLVVVPIGIAGQVVCMIATATAPDAPVAAVEAVAAAAGAALARLMHAASR